MKQFGVQNEKISGFWLDVLIYGIMYTVIHADACLCIFDAVCLSTPVTLTAA